MGGKKESIKEIVAKAGRNWDIGCYWDFPLFGCGNNNKRIKALKGQKKEFKNGNMLGILGKNGKMMNMKGSL